MVTKGEIQTIDYTSNTCTVRVPVFEQAGGSYPSILEAAFVIPPGVFNGYIVGDIVDIVFEDNSLNNAIIIGKTYQGAATEAKRNSGSLYGDSLNITGSASIPVTTKLTSATKETAVSTDASTTTYSSIQDIITAINNLKTGTTASISNLNNFGPNTITCQDLVTNIYGYTQTAFTVDEAEKEDGFYYLKFNGSKYITNSTAQSFMLYMTGNSTLPIIDETKYNSAWCLINGKIVYPIWDEEKNNLKFKIIIGKTFRERVIEIIEEYSSSIVVKDFASGAEVKTTSGLGAASTDYTVQGETPDKKASLDVEVKDLYTEEE